LSKVVISNIFSNISATLINIVAPLVIIPILTSSLGMNNYGIYVVLLAKVAFFLVLAELGFGMYLAKEISINREDISEVSSLFWIFLVTKLIAFTLVFGILILFSAEFGIVEKLLCVLVFFHLINITPILTGLENYKFLTIIQVVTKALMVLFVIITNFANSGLEKALALQIIIAALTSISLLLYFLINNKLDSIKFNYTKFRAVFVGCLPFYGAKLFVNLYQQSSTYFVSFALSTELVALYSIAIQLYKVGQSVIGAVARVLYTSTVKTKDFGLIKKLTFRSLFIHLSIFPVVFFYGDQLLGLVFTFDVTVLVDLSLILYSSLFCAIISSYWGYPALSAIRKENYAHIGILAASVAYFATFGLLMAFESNSIYLMIGCIFISELMGMLVRLFYARKFKLL
jgi:O-antigen/teichoic acid export membrane protein